MCHLLHCNPFKFLKSLTCSTGQFEPSSIGSPFCCVGMSILSLLHWTQVRSLNHTPLKPFNSTSVHGCVGIIWDHQFAPRFHQSLDVRDQWDIVNQFCVETLTGEGASWGFGKRTRGELPIFTQKKICPGQLPSGIAKTLKGSKLFNTRHRLIELFTRVQRPSSKPSDRYIFHRTAK